MGLLSKMPRWHGWLPSRIERNLSSITIMIMLSYLSHHSGWHRPRAPILNCTRTPDCCLQLLLLLLKLSGASESFWFLVQKFFSILIRYVAGWGSGIVNICVTFPVNKTMFRLKIYLMSLLNLSDSEKDAESIWLWKHPGSNSMVFQLCQPSSSFAQRF